MANIESVHKAFLKFSERAEKVGEDILSDTFVDTEPLSTILQKTSNQIIFGRRGTGKTHALKYLGASIVSENQHALYLDMRSIGSDGSIYNDHSLNLAERSVRLILDVLSAISSELYAIAVDHISSCPHPDQLTRRLDDLEIAISQVKYVGESTLEEEQTGSKTNNSMYSGQATAAPTGLNVKIGASQSDSVTERASVKKSYAGQERLTLNFGTVQSALNGLIEVLGSPKIWVLIDEWSEIPIALQPYLADLIRRTLLPLDSFVVKIAAIEHRSSFYLSKEHGEYIGLELGADMSIDLNLDDFLVFDNDQARSVDFFANLIFRHVKSSEFGAAVSTPENMIQTAFTQVSAFEELVRAAEGVPRDALNLASKVATQSYGRTVSVPNVRKAAQDWYQQDKVVGVETNTSLNRALNHIIEKVIGVRRARAFLVEANSKSEVIDRLFDHRMIHLLKKNISSHDNPGTRYNAFKIDYGCYVDLINTQKATEGLFALDEGGFTDVPVDDYRSIRRAILNVDELESV